MSLLNVYNSFWNAGLKCWSDMERRGVYLDEEACYAAADKADIYANECLSNFNDWCPYEINWGSSKQLSKFLYEFKNLPIPPVTGSRKAIKINREKKPSTSQASIEWLRGNTEYYEELGMLCRWREACSDETRVRKLPSYIGSDGRLHSVMAPTTDTGRGASKNPALQQIPGADRDSFGIRSCFRATPGHKLVVADYSQLELYVLAHYMIKWFNDYSMANALSDGDVHSNVARLAWPHLKKYPGNLKEHGKDIALYRSNVKSIIYGINYGKTATGLGVSIFDEHDKPIGKKKAQELIDVIVSSTGIGNYHDRCRYLSSKHGWVGTLAGRRRPLPEAQSQNRYEKARAHRQALNTPMQGGAADIVTQAMINLADAPLVLQVHDELALEVPEEQAEMYEAKLNAAMTAEMFGLEVQLKTDSHICDHWGEAK